MTRACMLRYVWQAVLIGLIQMQTINGHGTPLFLNIYAQAYIARTHAACMDELLPVYM